VTVRPVRASDAATWCEMRAALWPDGGETEHRDEVASYFRGEFPRYPWSALVAESSDARLLGFAEVSIRPYAEGCATSRVAYLEGWYVVPEARAQGVGRALIEATESWGRAQGSSELASDADADNHASAAAHRALGFTDVGLARCFRKDL
jgi:aminoglycoside 6'-N-acetyltransferase I